MTPSRSTRLAAYLYLTYVARGEVTDDDQARVFVSAVASIEWNISSRGSSGASSE